MNDGYKRLNLMAWFVGGPILLVAIASQIARIAQGGTFERDLSISLVTSLVAVAAILVCLCALVAPSLALKRRLHKSYPRSVLFLSRRRKEFDTLLDQLDMPSLSRAKGLPTYFVARGSEKGIEFWSPKSMTRALGTVAWGTVESVQTSTMHLYGLIAVPCLSLTVRAADHSVPLILMPSGRGAGVNPASRDQIDALVASMNELPRINKSP